ncbi:polyprenol monophosphomannose synthase [Thermomonospora umbrina]|uniref:Dolichol-phosphate mannosyltransferase n=1 Tax=Thermomonospora umbrina TaxID=111806 RepID=A0A3D9SY90_9ACTN|nr:polyprenol monophosphomannose synthase [Thermomonospora umbrina]REF00917.1 dolichol-phosphate mannosyltransferase [Thermomonospora umbrina]
MQVPQGLGRVLVTIPTYNERDNLERVVGRVLEAVPRVDVLVIDDSSPDGTGDLADTLAAADDRVKVLHRAGKEGLGAAYIAGFRWALERGYDVLVEMDADGSHQPEELPALLGALGDADVVIGARWVPGGRIVNWPRSREVLSRGANTYARMMLGFPLHDATGGYRAYRATALEKIGLDGVDSRGYCFQIDLAWRAVKADLRVAEVPITFIEREHGNSKMSRDIMAEAMWKLTRWGLAARVEQIRGRR